MTRWSVLRIATAGLILLGLTVVVGAVYLIGIGQEIPDGIIALGSAAVGAVATLMTTSQFPDNTGSGKVTVTTEVEKPDEGT